MVCSKHTVQCNDPHGAAPKQHYLVESQQEYNVGGEGREVLMGTKTLGGGGEEINSSILAIVPTQANFHLSTIHKTPLYSHTELTLFSQPL